MKKNKILVTLLSVIQIFAHISFPVFAEEADVQDNVAYIQFLDECVKHNITSATLGGNETPSAQERDGVECWVMDVENGENIDIIFASDFVDTSGTATYDIEIDYYDESKRFFTYWYEAASGKKYGDEIYLEGDGLWKSAKFTLDDAAFSNQTDGEYDLRLSLEVPVTMASTEFEPTLAIKQIRVTRNDNKNPIFVDSTIDESGAAFEWYSNNKIICDHFENRTNEALTVNVRRVAVAEETKAILFDETEEITFAPYEKKTVNFDFSEYDKCEQYEYKIFITSAENNINSEFTPIRFAVIKTDPNGIKNERVYMNTFVNQRDNYIDLIDVADKTNIGGVRMPAFWWMIEPSSAEKGTLVFDGQLKASVEKLREKNIKILPTLGHMSFHYSNRHNILPSTDTELEGFRNYVSFVARKFNEYGVEEFEIWNEPDLGDNDSVLLNDGVSYMNGTAYVPVYNIAYDEIKNVNENALVIGPGVCNGDSGTQFVDEALKAGWGETIEALSWHPYHRYRDEVTNSVVELYEQYKTEIAKYTGNESTQIWITESGVTPADSEVKSKENSGNWNTRKLYYLPSMGIDGVITLFNLDGRGLNEYDRQDMFGHLAETNADVYQNTNPHMPFAPMLKIAAECYVMADSTPTGNIYKTGDEVVLCEYQSNKFNADILAMNTVSTYETVTLQLGCDKLDYYDEFGNMTTIYGENGRYTFTLDESPSYIVGNFDGVEVVENNIVEYDKNNLSVISGTTSQLTIRNNTSIDCDIAVTGNIGIEILENNGFVDNKATVKLNVTAKEGTYSYITVKITDGDKVIQSSRIRVSVINGNSVFSAPAKFGRYSLSYFNTFDDYKKTDDSDVQPEGFRPWPQRKETVQYMKGLVAEDTGSRALNVEAIDKTLWPMFSFDTLVQEGTAHISFDMKSNTKLRLEGSTDKTGSRNPYSYIGMWKGEAIYTVYNAYFDMNYNEAGKFRLYGVNQGEDISVYTAVDVGTTDDEWHKYDLVFDLDKNTYIPYIDGERIYNKNLSQKYDLKNIIFNIQQNAASNGVVWIDNLAAYNYETLSDGTLKAPVMKAEEIDGVATVNGVVNVSFSEHITANSPAFTVTNVETGKQFTPTTVTKLANSSYKLTFASLDEGTYTVSATGITGTISGKAPVSEAVFSTSSAMKANEAALSLIDEDFSDYVSGIPTGWTELESGKAAITKVAGPNGENAINIAKANPTSTSLFDYASIYYLFDDGYKIHGDNFTIEFDVNNLETGWDIGLVRDSDLIVRDTTVRRSNKDRLSGNANYDATTTKLIAQQKYENVLFGSCNPNQISVTNNRWYFREMYEGNYSTPVAKNVTNTWHHIKADVNPQAATVTITVDNGTPETASFPPELFISVAHGDYDATNQKFNNNKYYHQIQGIRLTNALCKEKGVSFANVKVYKDTSYLTYQDFEGRLAENTDAGWYSPAGMGTGDKQIMMPNGTAASNGVTFDKYYTNYVNPYITTVEGKNGGTAAKFTFTGTEQQVVTLLSKPIEKNKAFVVEFDAKSDAAQWDLLAVPAGVENGGTTISIGKKAPQKSATEFQLSTMTGCIIGGNVSHQLGVGTMIPWQNLNNPAEDSETTVLGTPDVDIEEDVWYHYRYVVTPNLGGNKSSNNTQIMAELTAPDGTVTTYGIKKQNWIAANRLREFDTVGIAVNIRNSVANEYVAIDNLKVFQLDAATDTIGAEEIVKEAYMESVKVTGLDGEETYIGNNAQISANTKQIDVEFSTAITQAAADKITLKTASGDEIGTKTVSGNVCTISFAGEALPAGSTLTLEVKAGVATANGRTDDLHTYTIAINNDAELMINDMVLYETISTGAKGDIWLGFSVPSATIPVKGTSIVGTPRFIISGYNGKERTSILSTAAKYISEEQGERVSIIKSEEREAEAVTDFMIDIPISDVISAEGDIIKVFNWNSKTLKPFHNAWKYNAQLVELE